MITFKIVTPERVVYEDTITKVTIPTTEGEITVLPEHAPLVTMLSAGEMQVHKESGDMVELAIAGGVLEIRPDSEVYVMADTAERGEDIDLQRAQKAKERAEELLKEINDVADVDYARLQAVIERELARISVGNRYRR